MPRIYLDESLGMITNLGSLAPMETDVIETPLWISSTQENLEGKTFWLHFERKDESNWTVRKRSQ